MSSWVFFSWFLWINTLWTHLPYECSSCQFSNYQLNVNWPPRIYRLKSSWLCANICCFLTHAGGIQEHPPPQCSSHTVNRLVLFVSSGRRLLHSITMAWGIMMMHDTTQMTTILLQALLAVLLNIRGWQIAYQRSCAMQLSVRTDTDTEMVWKLREVITH